MTATNLPGALVSLAILLAACARPGPAPTAPEPAQPARAVEISPPEPAPVESQPSDGELAARPSEPARRRTEDGLVVEDLRLGSGEALEGGHRARMHYVGTLPDGTVFDSSRERGTPVELDIGKGYLIKGFEDGVIGMRVGGLRRLTIPPALGYGSRGAPGKIPPDSTLVFEIELLELTN